MSIVTILYLIIGFVAWLLFANSLTAKEIYEYSIGLVLLLPIMCVLWPIFLIMIVILFLKRKAIAKDGK